MYSNKENINILTDLLVQFGVHHAVVCPGSRNAPIVHNLSEHPDVQCYPVTDERSAGFFAIGIAQATAQPVVVCVTSGSALLNVAPAVAEAHYQHLPLIVVSADRPQAWIGQLDGQTLPQPDAFGCFVAKSVSLPEVHDDEERWYCNRLVNDVLLETERPWHPCVHINVPISEPLFTFDTPQLPRQRRIVRTAPATDHSSLCQPFLEAFLQAKRPMIVFGQVSAHDFGGDGLDHLFSHVIVLHEALAPFPSVSHFDEVLYSCDDEQLQPDFVVYVGNTIVSKRLRKFLRGISGLQVWHVTPSGRVEDPTMQLQGIVESDAEFFLQALNDRLMHRKLCQEAADFRRLWLKVLKAADQKAQRYVPAYSQMAAVSYFEERISALAPAPSGIHYANSSAIRLANIYARHYVWCNRGVNGIEGSLSTAAGFSAVSSGRVFCVVGDLSFFYDQNALWNQNLRGNLRILLINNGKGGIFDMLPGLEQSPARDRLVAGQHQTTAEGICQQNDVYYQQATDEESMRRGIDLLLSEDFSRPMLLEVLTDAATDAAVFKTYLR